MIISVLCKYLCLVAFEEQGNIQKWEHSNISEPNPNY